MGAAARFGVIVRSAGLLLAAVAAITRASRDDTAADSGRGVSLDLFFWDLRRTCWTRIQSAASKSEYTFALIPAGMEILVTGFGSQAKKKRAAFLARASTWCSFLFVDIGSVEIKLGHTNKEVPKKGKRLW